MEKEEELRLLRLLYNAITDKSVQKRFATTTTCNMATGELSNKRLIDECEGYVISRIKSLVEDK